MSLPANHCTMPEMATIPDEDLLLLLTQENDPQAFAELMRRYKKFVYVVAARMLRDSGEAEDMVQQVFLEIYRSRESFDPSRGTVRTWLQQFAYSRSINRLRYLSDRNFYHATEITEVENQMCPNQCPTAAIESRDLIQQALDGLNESQRRVIELSHFQGHSLREIAEESGEPYGAVRHHFYRGLKKMRLVLALPAET